MSTVARLIILGTIFALLGACSHAPKESKEYIAFTEQKNYAKTFSTYVDEKLLAKKKKREIKARVNLDQQRIRLIIDGRTAVDSPATTGKKDYETPIGTFAIIEKEPDKESNLYGKFYKEGTLVYTGSEKEYKEENDGEELEYDEYEGAPMPNWLRLTRDGVGIHQSKDIFRRPASHGCIRVSKKTSNILYAKLEEGSLVTVVQNDKPKKKPKEPENKTTKDDEVQIVEVKKTEQPHRISRKPAYMNKNLPAKERLRLLREHKKQRSS